jgi:hypothetical protein
MKATETSTKAMGECKESMGRFVTQEDVEKAIGRYDEGPRKLSECLAYKMPTIAENLTRFGYEALRG